ncbi:MAG: nucleoside deaminase, partial [Deltaproteobacteria bacterium]|nr:nucleoside deaminase [Deltaproteobacteria bacterium]
KNAADAGEVPVGAVVTRNDELVAAGRNCRELKLDPMGHAEIVALREAADKLKRWRLHDCVLYVTLEPCLMCAGAIILARIPQLVFAARDPKAGAVVSLYQVLQDSRLNHHVEIREGVMSEESSELLKNFFRTRRTRHLLQPAAVD